MELMRVEFAAQVVGIVHQRVPPTPSGPNRARTRGGRFGRHEGEDSASKAEKSRERYERLSVLHTYATNYRVYSGQHQELSGGDARAVVRSRTRAALPHAGLAAQAGHEVDQGGGTLTRSSPCGAAIADGEATGTIMSFGALMSSGVIGCSESEVTFISACPPRHDERGPALRTLMAWPIESVRASE